MLSKLLKHEFKATARLLLPLYLVLAVLTVFDRIVLSLHFTGTLSMITGFVTTAYIVSLIAIVVVSFVIIITRFYKNLMSDEGYLMFTLPVKPHQLINSKLIVSMVWTLASIAGVILSLLGVFATSDRLKLLEEAFVIQINNVKYTFGDKGFTLIMTELCILILFGLLHNILMIYLSIALGQLFRGHKLLGSFASYIAINTVLQILVTLAMVLAGFLFSKSFVEIDSLPQIIFPITIAYTVIFSALFYFFTNLIFRKKLNLE